MSVLSPNSARLGALVLLSLALVRCGSSTPPPQQQTQQQPPPQPPPEPPKETPKPPLLLVRPIRSVDTPRVPKTLVQDLSRKLGDQIANSGQYMLATTSTASEAANPDCLTESCELTAARDAAAKSVLHARLVQYAEQCVLLGVLYEVETGKNEWAFSRAFPCDSAGAEAAVGDLGSSFLGKSGSLPSGPVYAVAPVQHSIEDIAWASESFAEYLTTLLAAGGKTVVPASNVAANLEGKKEAHRGCGDKNCAIKLAASASAEMSLATKITKKKANCTIAASLYSVATKTSSASANFEGGCAAADIAGGLKTIAGELIGEAKPADDLR